MTILVMLFVLVSGAVMQSVVPGWPLLGQAKIPFLLAGVIYYALTRKSGTMLLAAVLAGFLQDALSPIPLGYSSFCFCVIGLLISAFRNTVFTESAFTAAFFGGVAAGVATLGINAMLWKDGLITATLWWTALKTAGATALGALFTPVVFLAGFYLDRTVGNVEARKEAFDEIRLA